MCDWNHLSLGNTVPAKPASKSDRDSELIQSHFAAQTKTFEYESQNATKITSALVDSCIQSPWPVMLILVRTLCLCLVRMTIFFALFHFSFFSQLCDHVVMKNDWCPQSEQLEKECRSAP